MDGPAGRALEAAEDDHRLAGEEVGDPGREDLRGGDVAPVDRDVREDRAIDLVVEAIDDPLRGLAGADVGDRAAADRGHAVEEVAVDRGADAEAEEAGVGLAEPRVDRPEDLVVVADVAVGEEEDRAHAIAVGGRIEGRLDPAEHLGAAAADHRLEVAEAALAVLRGVGEADRAEARGLVGEVEDLEGVPGLHAVQGPPHRRPRGVDRLAHHRPRRVDDEDQLARADRVLADHFGRRDGEREGAAIAVGLDEERRPRLRAGQRPGEDEVAVQELAGAGELDPRAVAQALDRDRVVLGVEAADRHAGVDRDADLELRAGGVARGDQRRAQARGVGDRAR